MLVDNICMKNFLTGDTGEISSFSPIKNIKMAPDIILCDALSMILPNSVIADKNPAKIAKPPNRGVDSSCDDLTLGSSSNLFLKAIFLTEGMAKRAIRKAHKKHKIFPIVFMLLQKYPFFNYRNNLVLASIYLNILP